MKKKKKRMVLNLKNFFKAVDSNDGKFILTSEFTAPQNYHSKSPLPFYSVLVTQSCLTL